MKSELQLSHTMGSARLAARIHHTETNKADRPEFINFFRVLVVNHTTSWLSQ